MIDKRIVAIIAGALVINLLLFIVMERMSAQQPVMLANANEVLSVDFVRLKRTPPPPEVKQRVKPPKKQELLTTPQMNVPSPRPMHIRDLTMTMPRMDIPMTISGVPFKGAMGAGGMGTLQEAIPLVRISPLYPPSALSRKIEGRVKIVFTVTEEGKVLNPVVIASKPKGIFDRAALRAIRKWKFNKRLEEGEAVQWQTVQTIIFQMDKS
jgi:protein TonB